MAIQRGQRLLHYEVAEQIGEGGMGVVWRGRDTKLDRDVAIKTLPDGFARDPDRLARFEREAKLLASLNHANIATIHGLEHDAGVHFLAMELVEGDDLAARIGRGAIPVEEALALALQIASALEAAHERGVIHRDLKPPNIKVTPEGKVKVLDFGLAKAFGPDAQDPLTSPTMSPTLTSAGNTAMGVILGTAAYMSPEQAKGKPVDRRADIWAFGVVLLEMLTGRLLFRGESVSETIAAVLTAEPDLSELPVNTPPKVRRLIERCLRKDPQSRLRDIGDARVVVEESLAGREWENAASELQPTGRQASVWTWVGVAAALVVGLVLGRVLFSRVEPPAPGPVHAELNLPAGTRLNGWGTPVVALSPDGRTVAFVADLADGTSRLFVRSLDSPTATEVPNSDTAEGPFFSPDGRWVAFAAGVSLRSGRSSELLKYSLDTGLTQTIAPLQDYFGGVWRDDEQLFFFNAYGSGLWQVSATGGEPRNVFAAFREDGEERGLALSMPALLPGGQKIVATDASVDSGRIVVIDLESGALTTPGISGNYAFHGPNGQLLFADDEGTLYGVPFDAKVGEPTGAPVALLDGLSLTRFGAAVVAASPTGNLVFSRGHVRGSRIVPSEMVRLDRRGSETLLPFDPEIISRGYAVSPSGDRLALGVRGSGVWIYDLERETRKNLPMDGLTLPWSIHWSPDDRRIAFSAIRDEQVVLAQQTVDGLGKPEVVSAQRGFELYAGSWLPDGKGFTYVEAGHETSRIMVRRLDRDADPEVLVDGLTDVLRVSVSPDGRWFAFDSAASGEFQIYAQAMTLDSERVVVTPEGGTFPRWSADSSELFYVNAGRLMAVDVPQETGDSFGRPRLILETDLDDEFSVGPDGDFYGYRPVEGVGIRTKLDLVLGWSAE
jgi:serine/threonine-protein kinase